MNIEVDVIVPATPEHCSSAWREIVCGFNASGGRVSQVVKAGEEVRVEVGAVLLEVNSFPTGYTVARTPRLDPPRQDLKENAEVVIHVARGLGWKEVFRRVYKNKKTVGGVAVRQKLQAVMEQVAAERRAVKQKCEAIRSQTELEEWVKKPLIKVVASESVFNKGLWGAMRPDMSSVRFRADMSAVTLVDGDSGETKNVWRVVAWEGVGHWEEVNYFVEKEKAQEHYRSYVYGKPDWWEAMYSAVWQGPMPAVVSHGDQVLSDRVVTLVDDGRVKKLVVKSYEYMHSGTAQKYLCELGGVLTISDGRTYRVLMADVAFVPYERGGHGRFEEKAHWRYVYEVVDD